MVAGLYISKCLHFSPTLSYFASLSSNVQFRWGKYSPMIFVNVFLCRWLLPFFLWKHLRYFYAQFSTTLQRYIYDWVFLSISVGKTFTFLESFLHLRGSVFFQASRIYFVISSQHFPFFIFIFYVVTVPPFFSLPPPPPNPTGNSGFLNDQMVKKNQQLYLSIILSFCLYTLLVLLLYNLWGFFFFFFCFGYFSCLVEFSISIVMCF